MDMEEDDDLYDADLNDIELNESDLEELAAFEQQLEDVDDEVLAGIDLEKGNIFIGAMKPRSSEEVLAELEREMEREAEEAKKRSMLNTCRPGVVPKYLVNPFALANPMDYEEVFGDIDKEEPQLRIWRIDRFAPVECTDDNWGKFCTGDCYIVLYITDDDEQLVIHIHHWIGLQATPDKYGAAAFRAVELNTYLGGGCRIYREVEATESKLFVDYFGDRIEYLFGGTPCAFRHVDLDKPREYPTRMYILSSNPSSRSPCLELVDLHVKHLVQDRVVLLDCGQRLFLWNGRLSRVKDRNTALRYAITIRSDERSDLAKIVSVDDGNEDFESQYDIEFFWKTLGGRVEPSLPVTDVAPVTKIGKRFMFFGPADSVAVFGSWDNFTDPCYMTKVDEEEQEWDLEVPLAPGEYLYMYKRKEGDFEETLCDMVRPTRTEGGKEFNIVKAEGGVDDGKFLLYTTYERDDGRLNLEAVDSGEELRDDILDSKHAFILDCKSELFVWFGLSCNPLEKEVAIALANKFLEFERPEWATVILIQETAEPSSFRSKFSEWTPRTRPESHPKVSKALSVKFDLPAVVNVESQLRKAVTEQPYSIVANSAGTLDVYVTGDGASFEAVPAHQRGIFFSGSSYVIVYKYSTAGARHLSYLVYFWSGISSNSNSEFSRFVLDFLSVLTKRVGADRVNAIRVRQGKEPMDFMRLFGHRMVVQNGSFATTSRYNSPSVRLFDVENRSVFDTLESRAVEVPAQHSSLSTERCFILQDKNSVRVWLGRETNDTLRGRALDIAAHLRKSDKKHKPVVSYFEEHVRDDSRSSFLALLDGNEDDIRSSPRVGARAFCCSFSGGLLEINELLDFCQFDLSLRSQDTILVHTEKILYVWVGAHATPSVFNSAMDSSALWLAYTEEHLSKQEVRVIHAGEEPDEFKALFHAWSNRMYSFEDTVGKRRLVELDRSAKVDALTRRNKAVYERMKQRMELLERVASSTRYSEKEECLVFKSKFVKKIDWEQAWIREGLLPAKVVPTPSVMESFKAAVDKHETVFTWEDGAVLAVSVAGSWNEWKQQPLLKMGTDGFALKMELPVGRYYYHYCVATEDGITHEIDTAHVAVNVKARDGELNNVIRVYSCIVDVVEEEEEEEAAEEVDESKLSVDELIKREKEWRRQQREQREKRLQRQLEEQRALHSSKKSKKASASTPSPSSSSPRSTRRSRLSSGSSSPNSGAFMDSLLDALGTSPKHRSGLRASARGAQASSGSPTYRPSIRRISTSSAPRSPDKPAMITNSRSLTRGGSGDIAAAVPRQTSLPPKTSAINTSLEAIAIVDAASVAAKKKVKQGAAGHRRRVSSEAASESAARLEARLSGAGDADPTTRPARRTRSRDIPSESSSSTVSMASRPSRERSSEEGTTTIRAGGRATRVTAITEEVPTMTKKEHSLEERQTATDSSADDERARRRAERRRQLGLE